MSVRLPRKHAIVLFDLLSRYSDTDRLEIVDQAEHRAFWGADLDTALSEPFRAAISVCCKRPISQCATLTRSGRRDLEKLDWSANNSPANRTLRTSKQLLND